MRPTLVTRTPQTPLPVLDLPRGAVAPAEALAFLRQHGTNTDPFRAQAAHHRQPVFEGRGLSTLVAIVHGALNWAAERTCAHGR